MSSDQIGTGETYGEWPPEKVAEAKAAFNAAFGDAKGDAGRGVVKIVNFGSLADRKRAELADALAAVAEHIRRGELEHDPHGWVLLLHSDENPGQFEVLNMGIRTKDDMDAATRAMRRHIETI